MDTTLNELHRHVEALHELAGTGVIVENSLKLAQERIAMLFDRTLVDDTARAAKEAKCEQR